MLYMAKNWTNGWHYYKKQWHMLEKKDLKDIQGLILFGYKHAPVAQYVFLQITDAAAAKVWLAGVVGNINRISKQLDRNRQVVNIAFTYKGLEKLGLFQDTLQGFSAEFMQGMDHTHRNCILGDTSESASEKWQWGGKSNEEIHILVCLYSIDAQKLKENLAYHRAQWQRFKLKEVHALSGHMREGGKEPFGFKDGISQPVIQGTGRKGLPGNTVKAGEFVLGYPNEYGEITHSPLVWQSNDPNNILPYRETFKDFGRNGSYMVFRQLQQDVVDFWQYMQKNSHSPDEMIKLSSKMMGRWPSGAPVTKFPEKDPGGYRDEEDDDHFGYRMHDAKGYGCPFGAHLRRSNPRDALPNTDNAKESVALVNRHRIIRRGRPYGKSISTINPLKILQNKDTLQAPVGLHFICFNSNIATQFEFIQQAWVNRATFHGLHNSHDPVVGNGQAADFYVQQQPISKRYRGIPRFVQTIGGDYFFMPGIRAVKFLANLP